MVLTTGATHNLVGTGVQAISASSGLAIALTSIPGGASGQDGTPQRYFRIGRIHLGTALGYGPPIHLETAAQLVYPFSAEFDRFGYTLIGGLHAAVTELTTLSGLTQTTGGVTFSADKGNQAAGSQSTLLSWANYAGTIVQDYISVQLAAQPDGTQIDYWHLGTGTHANGTTPTPNGSFVVNTTLAAGSYQWRLMNATTGVATVRLPFTIA